MGDISEQQNSLYQHFNDVACTYNNYRTLDEAPVNHLKEIVGTESHSICNLGCGTGRYLVALLQAFKSVGTTVSRVYGVDTSSAMLEKARIETGGLNPDINWLLCSASKTGLPDQSISLVTAFNSIHHLPVEETLNEVKRMLKPEGLFAVYTRLLEQESEHIWGRYFPEYVDHSTVFTREFMSRFSKYDQCWQLIEAQDFTFKRQTTLSQICEQTRSKHYSTLSRYSEEEFEIAYNEFVENIKAEYQDLDDMEYLSSYSLFVYQHV